MLQGAVERCPAERGTMKTQTTRNYRCPNCGASVRYDAAFLKAVCEHCGSSFEPEALESSYWRHDAYFNEMAEELKAGGGVVPSPAFEGMAPVEQFLARAPWVAHSVDEVDDSSGLRVFSCESCGANIVVDYTVASASCPYCGNATVMRGMLAGDYEPDAVVPFRVDEDAAAASLTAYVNKLWIVPKGFKREIELQHIVGMYVPFWLYSATAEGDLSFTLVGRKARDGSPVSDYSVYECDCDSLLQFERVPVDSSLKMPDGHMDAIEPYDFGELRPFAGAYLSGFAAECGDLDAARCAWRAATRMANSTWRRVQHRLEDELGGVRCIPEESGLGMSWEKIEQVLLPVWMLHATWKGKDYLMAMNGQTGKLVGDLPVSNVKRYGLFALLLAVLMPLAVMLVMAAWGVFFAWVANLPSSGGSTESKNLVGVFLGLISLTAFLPTAAYAAPCVAATMLVRRARMAKVHSAAEDWAVGEPTIEINRYECVREWSSSSDSELKLMQKRLMGNGKWRLLLGRESFAKVRPAGCPGDLGGADGADAVDLPKPAVLEPSDRKVARKTGVNWRAALGEWCR